MENDQKKPDEENTAQNELGPEKMDNAAGGGSNDIR